MPFRTAGALGASEGRARASGYRTAFATHPAKFRDLSILPCIFAPWGRGRASDTGLSWRATLHIHEFGFLPPRSAPAAIAEASQLFPHAGPLAGVVPDHKLYAIASDSPYLLGVLSSRMHRLWALAAGGRLGVGNDPTWSNTTTFLPFPFPCPENDDGVVRKLGEALDTHRKRQLALHANLIITDMYNVLEKLRAGTALNPREQVIHEQGLVSVLRQIHDDLDAAVAEAYGWPANLSDEEILTRLVALNAERAAEERRGLIRWLRPEFQNAAGPPPRPASTPTSTKPPAPPPPRPPPANAPGPKPSPSKPRPSAPNSPPSPPPPMPPPSPPPSKAPAPTASKTSSKPSPPSARPACSPPAPSSRNSQAQLSLEHRVKRASRGFPESASSESDCGSLKPMHTAARFPATP